MSSVCSTASFLSALLNPTTISSLLISRLKYPQLMKNGGYTSYTHIFHANTNIGSKDLCFIWITALFVQYIVLFKYPNPNKKKSWKRTIVYTLIPAVKQGSYAVWKRLEFDFSQFQLWISMEQRKQSLKKKLCLQTIAPSCFQKSIISSWLFTIGVLIYCGFPSLIHCVQCLFCFSLSSNVTQRSWSQRVNSYSWSLYRS